MLYLILKQPKIHQTEVPFRNMNSFPCCENIHHSHYTSSFLTFQELNCLPIFRSYSSLLVIPPTATIISVLWISPHILLSNQFMSLWTPPVGLSPSPLQQAAIIIISMQTKHLSQLQYDFKKDTATTLQAEIFKDNSHLETSTLLLKKKPNLKLSSSMNWKRKAFSVYLQII